MVALRGATADQPDDEETKAASRAEWSLVTPGRTTSADLITVRIPERAGGHAVLSDRLLVVAPEGAVRVEAVKAGGGVVAGASLERAAGVLDLPVGATVTLRALDRDGHEVASTPLRELPGPQLFGEPLISNW
jgi:hypothetical protein